METPLGYTGEAPVGPIAVNCSRGRGWAYRDMLFIQIDYGERAHEVVFGPMTEAERRSHFGAALVLGGLCI